MEELRITSPSFQENEMMPKRYTCHGENISPGFVLENLSENAKSLVIIMDDLDVPLNKEFTHWIIWNIPAMSEIPENISKGAIVKELDNAFQGVAYGKNGYKGPKLSLLSRRIHHYVFTVYALDTKLDLLFSADKKLLLKTMEKHILQKGNITVVYQR